MKRLTPARPLATIPYSVKCILFFLFKPSNMQTAEIMSDRAASSD
jgi:hypothetical protein